MINSALTPEDNLLLKNAIEAEASKEALAKGNKKIHNKRKDICVQYYRTRRRINSESFYFPDLSFFDRCSKFPNHVSFNHEAPNGDMFNDSIREDRSYKLTENDCFLLQDNHKDLFNPGIEMKDDTHMLRIDSDNSSAVTDVEYANLHDSVMSFSNKDYIICSLNTEDSIDDIPNSQILNSPESVLEDSSFSDDESTSISHVDSVQLSEEKIICNLNTEDPEIPCNDNIFLQIHPSTSVKPETDKYSIDPLSSFTESQMDGPDLSYEFDSVHPLVGNTPEDVSMDCNISISDPNNSADDNDDNDDDDDDDDDDDGDVGDDDLPCFPDIEALIVKLDFEYAQESWITNEAKRCKYMHSKRTINGLKQSSFQTAMSSLGAFAVFYSHHFNYYIKKTEVIIGRSTDDNEVDIDLRKENHANMISRKQATIKMETDGTFALKNIGKGFILVKGKAISHGQVAALDSSCFIQIRGMDFMFEINDSYVRWYLDNIIKKTQGKFRTFEWTGEP